MNGRTHGEGPRGHPPAPSWTLAPRTVPQRSAVPVLTPGLSRTPPGARPLRTTEPLHRWASPAPPALPPLGDGRPPAVRRPDSPRPASAARPDPPPMGVLARVSSGCRPAGTRRPPAPPMGGWHDRGLSWVSATRNLRESPRGGPGSVLRGAGRALQESGSRRGDRVPTPEPGGRAHRARRAWRGGCRRAGHRGPPAGSVVREPAPAALQPHRLVRKILPGPPRGRLKCAAVIRSRAAKD